MGSASQLYSRTESHYLSGLVGHGLHLSNHHDADGALRGLVLHSLSREEGFPAVCVSVGTRRDVDPVLVADLRYGLPMMPFLMMFGGIGFAISTGFVPVYIVYLMLFAVLCRYQLRQL